MGATVAAAIVAKAKRIVDAFHRAGASTPTSAVAPSTIGVSEGLAFRKLCAHSVIREASAGTFYVDEASWQAWLAIRRRIALFMLLLVVVVGLVVWIRTR